MVLDLFHLPVLASVGPDKIEKTIRSVLDRMDIGAGGYFVLFGLLFSCGLGMPIPEDIPLLVAGALIGSYHMKLAPAAILAWCGIIGGDCVLYFMGRRFGLNITSVPVIGKLVTKGRIEKLQKLFQRSGIWVVAIGRLLAGVRGVMVVSAGTIRYNFAKFIIADGLAAIISGGLFLFLGWEFADKLPMVAHQIERSGWELAVVLSVIVVGFIAYEVWRTRRLHREHKAEIHEETSRGLDPRIAKPPIKVPAK